MVRNAPKLQQAFSCSTEIESILRLIPTRFVYFIAAVAVVLAGLASRRYREQLPAFLAEYAGDTLWALMVFLLVSVVLASRPLMLRAAIALGLSFLVEISQLYHAPWIDSIRQTTLGGLVLGFGFLWSDLVCYSVGIAIGSLTEREIRRVSGPELEKVSGRQDLHPLC